MNINGTHYTTIWMTHANEKVLKIIDQRDLPFRLTIEEISTLDGMCTAIRDMHLRGAPLIGVAGAFGMYLALLESSEMAPDTAAENAKKKIIATRPTAVNLVWAVQRVFSVIQLAKSPAEKIQAALSEANAIREFEIENCRKIGEFGLPLIEKIAGKKKGAPVHILTHCNAGWLACIDYGTATAPIYAAHDAGIPVHVWVDETRPRNQGARITAFELGEHGVPHTVIADNTGGHLMQHGMVDMVIVGSDRTTRRGDVCNKIGTYLKALAAADSNVPFYAALPSSTIDFSMSDGIKEIPIEMRDENEVHYVTGMSVETITDVRITPKTSKAVNYAFDVTPARLVTGLITERGVCRADETEINTLFGKKCPPASGMSGVP
ncbi:MAG: S-methyl-5-thioribose-1-phosphate isomerase [Spirochaetales bacterium]|nr:S-methyl-5-thioribose-1-phosphate isomerase [Spirochaetales bacterium]